MNADDARIKDTISNLRKVEKHLYGTNTRVALLLKHGLDELEALLAAPPLGEVPMLTVEQIHKLIDENTTPFGGWLCSPNKLADEVAALRESQPPRVEETDLKRADREHQIRAKALEEAARILESEFFNEVDTFFRGGKIPTVSEWNDEAIKVSEHIRALIPQAAQGFAKRREAEIRCELLESLANSSKCPHCEESLRERAESSRRALAGATPGEETKK